jgi:hypothetical protein
MAAPKWVVLATTMAGLSCAEGPAPPPSYALRAGHPTVTVRWQQFCEQAANVSQASWLASSRGNDGWELVSMYAGVLCYKRPVPVIQAPAAPPPATYGQAGPGPGLGPMPGPVSAPTTNAIPRITDPGF